MNAPANIPQRDRAAAWEKYLPAVETLRPGTSAEEARHRAGLMLLRDMAANGQRTASEPSAMALQAVEQIASIYALASLSADQLDATRLALVRLYTGARDLERVFGDNGGR